MLEINRGLMVVKPKQPFLDWLRSIDENELKLNLDINLEALRVDSNAYLIPEWETQEELADILIGLADFIFEEELRGWYIDEEFWPTERGGQVFLDWFDVELHGIVFDLDEETPLERIEYADDFDGVDPESNGH